jgi:hypothetical protein
MATAIEGLRGDNAAYESLTRTSWKRVFLWRLNEI